MKKTVSISILLIALAGCSSQPELKTKVTTLELNARDARGRVARNMRSIASNKIKLQYLQETPSEDNYENVRLKNQIDVLDATFTRDLDDYLGRLRKLERLIETQTARIKTLEDAQPLAESLNPKRPSFRKTNTPKR